MSLQLSSEQSVGDVGITQLDWKRASSAVGHETAVVGQVERRLPGQRLANQACHFELDALSVRGVVLNKKWGTPETRLTGQLHRILILLY